MIGILIGLAISWALLYFLEKKSLLALGVLPLPGRLGELGLGFVLTGLLCVGVQLLEASLQSAHWVRNPDFTTGQFFQMLYWDFKSVFTEELLFRGAILYVLIRKIGASKSILLSALAFGVYHWFSFGIIGAIVPMLVVLIGTGLMGYAWALAFYKTESMALPLGLHLGWNFTFNTIFSRGPLGEGLFQLVNDGVLPSWFSLIGLWVIPVVILFLIRVFVSERNIEFKP
ncbi:CPBP family intramembrane glutamic endopeptidase [Lewinella sp. W8]|uniref:CPBP family intramembrane glutamic endopeptidase n=1 Tax=Lewinella sp. W8 TaxID=2528208 RepID=UPI00106769DE|nr:CPBP family intramembrane glutamic endopeptidase [Lewinella sp. W8]MTB51167.1 CPBP family intramembrane metalloprotease [Lewinella sp. W8]